jgi:hypothetical protein
MNKNLKVGDKVEVQIENSEPLTIAIVELRPRLCGMPPAVFVSYNGKTQIVRGLDNKWYVASAH